MGFNVKSFTSKIGLAGGGAIGTYLGGVQGGLVGASLGKMFGSQFGPSDARLEERTYNARYNQQLRDSLMFWNMQNEYNSPVQQMNRLRAAGLNPMLIYGSGSVDGNTSGTISVPSPSYRGTSSSKSDFLNSYVARFFLNKSMENAEDQNARNELINENWRLKNLKLAKEIEGRGNVSLSNKIRADKPMSVSERKYIDKINENIYNSSYPTDVTKVKGVNNIMSAYSENASFYLFDALLNALEGRKGLSDIVNRSGSRFNAFKDRR